MLKGYEGLKTKAKETPPNGSTRLTEAAERLKGCENLLDAYAQRVFEAHDENR